MWTIRRGMTRTVLLTRRWAVKFPSMRAHDEGLPGVLWSMSRGVLANLSERSHSHEAGVCPVHWSLAGLVNVYPRCEPALTELVAADYDAIGCIGPMQRKPENVGYLNGVLVYVDYDREWNDRPRCAHLKGTAWRHPRRPTGRPWTTRLRFTRCCCTPDKSSGASENSATSTAKPS